MQRVPHDPRKTTSHKGKPVTEIIRQLRQLTQRTRQHHAIEHATLHMLAARTRGSFVALSDPQGFTVLGDVDETTLRRAVGDALLRLQAGDSGLAIHPNCGTGFAVSTLLATTAAMLGFGGARKQADAFPLATLLVLAALIAAKPLGLRLQDYTTSAQVSDRWVAAIAPVSVFGRRGHRVIFE